jgi:hypothetical protein
METGFKLGGTSMAKNIKSKKKKGEGYSQLPESLTDLFDYWSIVLCVTSGGTHVKISPPPQQHKRSASKIHQQNNNGNSLA